MIMKTFKDLIFQPHPLKKFSEENEQAIMFFPNGYGVSVLFGKQFYSNGIDTYELAVLKGDEREYNLTYKTPITRDVLGNLTEGEVTQAMIKVQQLEQQSNERRR